MLTYKYDANSRLTEASDPAATYTFTYDNLGRNTSTEHDLAALGFDVVVDEAYDALGRRTSLAAEIDGTDDLINSYAYDYQNRMTQVTQGSQSGGNTVAEKRADFSYDAEDKGQFTSVTRYADLAGSELVATSSYGYDAADRLTSLAHGDSSSSTLAGYTWGYDEGNRLTDFTVAGYSAEDATYTYDDTDQLTGADRSGTTSDESYTYDENGNRTGGSYTTGDNNQILSDGTYNYTYDDEGNRLTKTNTSTGDYVEYTWDYRNRLVNITTKTSGGTVTHEVDYTYDIFNRRIGKTIDADGDGPGTATEEVYIYDGLREEQGNAGDHILLAFDESDDLTDRFLYGPNVDQVLASEEVTSTASAGDALWALTDHLGTVRDVADYNAGTNTTTVQNHLTYDAFGNITAETNAAVDFLFAFTGRERDAESDLQYNRARYYDAAIGKWISEDPIGFDAGDENLVRYVHNTTPARSDKSGLEDVTPPFFNLSDPDDFLNSITLPDTTLGNWTVSGSKQSMQVQYDRHNSTNSGLKNLIAQLEHGNLFVSGGGDFTSPNARLDYTFEVNDSYSLHGKYSDNCGNSGSFDAVFHGTTYLSSEIHTPRFNGNMTINTSDGFHYDAMADLRNGKTFEIHGIDEVFNITAKIPDLQIQAGQGNDGWYVAGTGKHVDFSAIEGQGVMGGFAFQLNDNVGIGTEGRDVYLELTADFNRKYDLHGTTRFSTGGIFEGTIFSGDHFGFGAQYDVNDRSFGALMQFDVSF